MYIISYKYAIVLISFISIISILSIIIYYKYKDNTTTNIVAISKEEETKMIKQAQEATKPEDNCQADELINYIQKEYPLKPNTIFVSVASYRDDECRETINNLFDHANQPDRIFVGVVQQNKLPGEDCFESCEKCKKRKERGIIRVKTMDYTEARGPTLARFWCSTLWQGEQYYLQIDSHSQFEQDWDKTLIKELESTNDPKAIIGGYPPTGPQMEQFKKDNFKNIITAHKTKITPQGIPDIASGIVARPSNNEPVKMYFSGAGMMCMPGQAIVDVPYDPYLAYLFFGEEILHCARLWTAGYNFYAPKQAFVVHHYTRTGKPKFWEDKKNFTDCQQKAIKRVRYLLGQIPLNEVPEGFRRDIKKYGMGNKRTLEQYYKEAKIDLVVKKQIK